MNISNLVPCAPPLEPAFWEMPAAKEQDCAPLAERPGREPSDSLAPASVDSKRAPLPTERSSSKPWLAAAAALLTVVVAAGALSQEAQTPHRLERGAAAGVTGATDLPALESAAARSVEMHALDVSGATPNNA